MPLQSVNDIVKNVSDDSKSYIAYFSKYIVATPSAGYWYDFSMRTGDPVANPYTGTTPQATQLDNSSTGALWHGGNVSPATKHIISVSLNCVSGWNVFLFCDYLLYYPYINLNTTTQQNLSNPVGLPRYTDGKGVRIFCVTTTAAGVTSANLTISYTNQDGISGRQLPINISLAGSSPVEHIPYSTTGSGRIGPFLPLAQGDSGVRSVQWVKLSKAMGAGRMALVLCKPLFQVFFPQGYTLTEREFVKELPALPRVYDGAYLSFLVFATGITYRTMITGLITFAWN